MRFARRLLCILLALGILLNSTLLTLAEDDFELELEALEDGELFSGELEDSLFDDPEENQPADNALVYRMDEGGSAMLSDVLEALELKLDLRDIEMVTVMGGGTVYVEDLGVMETTSDLVAVESLEDDYVITAMTDFVEAGIVVYTQDNM